MPEFVFTMHNVRKKLGEKLVLDPATRDALFAANAERIYRL